MEVWFILNATLFILVELACSELNIFVIQFLVFLVNVLCFHVFYYLPFLILVENIYVCLGFVIVKEAFMAIIIYESCKMVLICLAWKPYLDYLCLRFHYLVCH